MKSIYKLFTILILLAFLLEGIPPKPAAGSIGSVRYAKPGASGAGDCSTWDDACSLQDALTGAVSGDEIWAAAGTYKPTTDTNRNATFQLVDGVAVYGGFAGTENAREDRDPSTNVSILSGDLNGNDNTIIEYDEPTRADNSIHVVTGISSATLDGFTISAGNADGDSCPGPMCGGGIINDGQSPTLTNLIFNNNSANMGGGMLNWNSSPILTDVSFSGNTTSSYGGGIYNGGSSPTLNQVTFNGNAGNVGGGMCNRDGSSPTLIHVTFTNNSGTNRGGGMASEYGSNPTLTDVTFSGNTSDYGGGMENRENSNPTLTEVTFSNNSADNYGGGMSNESSTGPTLTDVTFSGNTAGDGGGGMHNKASSPILTGITFKGNTSDYGGGMSNESVSNPTLTNITFFNNTATYNGGGMDNKNSTPILKNVTFKGNSANAGGGMNNYASNLTIDNSILWGNTASSGAQIYDQSSTPVVRDSVVEGNYPGGTNIITTDPLLGTLGNYGGFTQTIPLMLGSSAMDRANDSICPAADQRGVTRPQGIRCDIGAFELVYYRIVLPLVTR
jgi:predicted outer membrane repeat protein